jgi:hypothetical protein
MNTQDILADVKSIVVQTMADSQLWAAGVPMTQLIGALRGSWRSSARRPVSGRRWSLSKWGERELEDAIESSADLRIEKVFRKRDTASGHKVLVAQYVKLK